MIQPEPQKSPSNNAFMRTVNEYFVVFLRKRFKLPLQCLGTNSKKKYCVIHFCMKKKYVLALDNALVVGRYKCACDIPIIEVHAVYHRLYSYNEEQNTVSAYQSRIKL